MPGSREHPTPADIKVGEPTNAFIWPCSDSIGRVIDARLDVDAAIVQVNPGSKYKPHIEGIGPIDGALPGSMLKSGLPVQKRGMMSRLTSGMVERSPGHWNCPVDRGVSTLYKNAMVIESTTIAEGRLKEFILPGDSGSSW